MEEQIVIHDIVNFWLDKIENNFQIDVGLPYKCQFLGKKENEIKEYLLQASFTLQSNDLLSRVSPILKASDLGYIQMHPKSYSGHNSFFVLQFLWIHLNNSLILSCFSCVANCILLAFSCSDIGRECEEGEVSSIWEIKSGYQIRDQGSGTLDAQNHEKKMERCWLF